MRNFLLTVGMLSLLSSCGSPSNLSSSIASDNVNKAVKWVKDRHGSGGPMPTVDDEWLRARARWGKPLEQFEGDDGATGPKGDTGETGAKGEIGDTGAKGDKGDDGTDGTSIESFVLAKPTTSCLTFTTPDGDVISYIRGRRLHFYYINVHVGAGCSASTKAASVYKGHDAFFDNNGTQMQIIFNVDKTARLVVYP